MQSTLRSFSAAAVRLVTFRRVPEDQLDVSWLQLLGIALFSLVPPLIFSLWSVGFSEGTVSWMYLPGMLFHLAVMLVAAIVTAHLVGRPDRVVMIMAATMLAWTLIDAVALAGWGAIRSSFGNRPVFSSAFYYGPLAWLALAVGRFAVSLAQVFARRLVVFVALALFLALPLTIYRERSIWTVDYGRKADRVDRSGSPASEEAFYRQPALLRDELEAVKPGRKGIVDLYLVAVAAYGAEDVFMREADSVAKLFRERFGAEGHIVQLVNNRKTALSRPVASATSLKAALARIAAVMDKDEDVLVLFLTSHGSEDHQLSVQLWPLEFKQITPAILREALDESGIKNRVVIVSSCYSGGFLPKLESENTLVISAAARDRTSFGCSNENEWTYFGRAYFDEALRKTYSFTQAFELARPVIEQREKAENFDPSMPQISVGNAIKPKLEALERQLAQSAPEQTKEAAAREPPNAVERYVSLVFEPSITAEYLETCRQSMASNSPDKWLEREGSFFGLTRTSKQWPNLVAAWNRYADRTCVRINDPALYRVAYTKLVNEMMTAEDLDIATRMFTSQEGQRWYALERQINRRMTAELSKAQREIDRPLYEEFIKERDRIFATSR